MAKKLKDDETWREVQARSRQANLPEWLHATVDPVSLHISIDCDEAWPVFGRLLRADGHDPVRDQYWWAVFRRCVTTACRDALGEKISISLDGSRHPRIPEGKGREAGAAEFRKYYRSIKS